MLCVSEGVGGEAEVGCQCTPTACNVISVNSRTCTLMDVYDIPFQLRRYCTNASRRSFALHMLPEYGGHMKGIFHRLGEGRAHSGAPPPKAPPAVLPNVRALSIHNVHIPTTTTTTTTAYPSSVFSSNTSHSAQEFVDDLLAILSLSTER